MIICQIKEWFRFTSHLVEASLFMSGKFPDYDCKFPEDTVKTVYNVHNFLNLKNYVQNLQ